MRSEESHGALALTLNQPETKNALIRAMHDALGNGIEGVQHDDDVRCVLIQAEGDLFRPAAT